MKAARWDHVAAAFVAVVLIAYAQSKDPQFPNPGPIATVGVFGFWAAVMWECIVRLFRLVTQGRLTSE